MAEFPEDMHDEDPEHVQRVADIDSATTQIDPNNWIVDGIDRYKERVKEIEMGVTTDYDPTSYANDSVYKDPVLAELQEDLEDKYRTAVLAVADLHKAERATQERREVLRTADLRAQLIASRVLSAEDVTVQDIFSGDVASDS